MDTSPKTILHLSAFDFGGAGQFTLDFHRLLKEEGHQSFLVVKDKKNQDEDVWRYPDSGGHRLGAKLLRRITRLNEKPTHFDHDYYFFNKYERYTFASADRILGMLPVKPDLIFIHWVTDFINARLIGDLYRQTGAKILWLMLDNAPLTGGCHYPWDCPGYEEDCGGCPAVVSEPHKKWASQNMAFKISHLPESLILLAFSENDYKRAAKSTLFKKKRIEKLLGFVDEARFGPGDVQAARAYFGVPVHKKVVFFGASSPHERRKGMSLLLRAIGTLDGEDFFLLVAGTMNADALPEKNIKMVGHLSETELIKAYQAAHVFVCPSLEDSGPMMINQALMCGTPVVAFDVGVAQDLVLSEKTGYRAIPGKYEDLAHGLSYVLSLDKDQYRQMKHHCRALALEKYSRAVYLRQLRAITHPAGKTSLLNA